MINQKLEQNIYLIGFMAAGKSSVGKKLAETLNFQFIDLDAVSYTHLTLPTSYPV